MRLASTVLVCALLASTPSANAENVAAPETLRVPRGFKVELIYNVPKAEQGSWVSMTADPRGRLIASDQFGGLFRLTPPPAGSSEQAKVEKLKVDLGGAHGLLYAFGSLYVMVNEEPHASGLWRLRDTDGDDQFDEKKLLRPLKGRGEHGPHGLTLSPDGKSIYFACGNDTKAPMPLEQMRPSRPLAEDQVPPRLKGGELFSEKQPMAYTARVDPDGLRFEVIAIGLRNHYDIAFNALGDLFTYDSDMEWDAGTPWYRPTRICMLMSGADFGFRDGSGKFPGYYPDSLPSVIDIGPGSPTGVVSGQGAKFPARYQHAIFVNDWTYGTMYAIHLTPQGGGYSAEKEEFVVGKPLPLTDVVVVPQDGAMYFAIGGRRTQSAVYRVSYIGDENTSAAPPPVATPEHKLRRELERLHDEGTGPEAIETAWPHLGHPDRFVRWAARVAIERQPVDLWAERALKEQDPQAFLEGAIALARVSGSALQPSLWARLNSIGFARLDVMQQLALVRVYEISLARAGVPDEEGRTRTITRLEALYPAQKHELNRELSRTLVALGSEAVVAKTMKLMATARNDDLGFASAPHLQRNTEYGDAFSRTAESRPNLPQIDFAYALRAARTGWAPDLRRAFFSWFARTARWTGGNDFRPFIEEMRSEALRNVPESERAVLAELSNQPALPSWAANVKPPRGPGKNYTVDEVASLAKERLKGRSFENGRNLFAATNCLLCHRFQGEGGGVGPDLTAAANRFTLRDLLENIIEPSKVISDQYESTVVEKKDGSTIIGLVIGEDHGNLLVATNALVRSEVTAIPVAEITSRKPHPVSIMPPGLINALNHEELLDLLAYIQSSGSPNDKMFAKP